MKEDIKTDALLEVLNIGAGQSATALSEILRQKVLINVPDLKFLPIDKVTESLGGAEQKIVGIYFQINGDITGKMLLLFDQKTGHMLAEILTGDKTKREGKLSDIDMSAMMEMANIIANSCLNGLAGLLDMRLMPSIPYYAEDELGAVIDFLLIEMAIVSELAMLVNTEMSTEKGNIKGSLLVFPDDTFMNKIFERLELQKT
ncbi:MAG: chemotaxis protein CheC [Endomicrobiales bacterium]|nr:chemotaxis protein CheC [Endomicrobiales bacterium]